MDDSGETDEVKMGEVTALLELVRKELASFRRVSQLPTHEPATRIVDEGTLPYRKRQISTNIGGDVLVQKLNRMIKEREIRERHFDKDFCDGASWNIIIDLTRAKVLDQSISVTSACIAARVPPTTALRHINQLVEAGVVERLQDAADLRRAWLTVSHETYLNMCRYFMQCQELKL